MKLRFYLAVLLAGALIIISLFGFGLSRTLDPLGQWQLRAINPEAAGRRAIVSIATPNEPASIGTYLNLPILIDSAGANVRGVDITVHYSADLLKLEALSLDKTFCTSDIVSQIQQDAGLFHFACQAPDPGLPSQLGTVVTPHFVALAAGSAHISFDSNSIVQGRADTTNVLAFAQASSFGIAPAEPLAGGLTAEKGSVDSAFVPQRLTVLEGSCNGSTLDFSWLRQAGVTSFLYSWSNAANATPINSTISTTLTVPLKPDAVQYLSVRAVGQNGKAGPTSVSRVVNCPSI